MDNESLLAWAEHEIERTKKTLRVAEEYAEELRYKVKEDTIAKGRRDYVESRLRFLGVPEDIWINMESLNELLAILKERKDELKDAADEKKRYRATLHPLGVSVDLWNTVESVSGLIEMAIARREFLRTYNPHGDRSR